MEVTKPNGVKEWKRIEFSANRLSRNVTQCHAMSRNVTQCHAMSRYVTRQMAPRLPTHNLKKCNLLSYLGTGYCLAGTYQFSEKIAMLRD